MSLAQPVIQFGKGESSFQTRRRLFDLAQATNGGIDFGSSTQTSLANYTGNMNGQWVNPVTAPGVANTEFPIAHNLGRIPNGYLIFWKDRSADLYQGPATGTAWTTTQIFVKCTVANAVFAVFLT